MTVMVRTFVGALTGPTDLVGAFFESSSNQLLCFVASFVLVINALRSAVKTVAKRFLSEDLACADEAATMSVIFFLRLNLWPDSVSESEEESSLSDGGGVVRRFLTFSLAFVFLFLNVTIRG